MIYKKEALKINEIYKRLVGDKLFALQPNVEVLRKRFEHVLSSGNSMIRSNDSEVLDNIYKEKLEKDETWLQAVDEMVGDEKIVFVYGFDRGLSLADLLERYPNRWFFVYEPNVEAFNHAISEYDLSLIFEHPNFYWLSVGEEQLHTIFHMLCSYNEETLVFIALRHYLEADMKGLHKIKEQFKEYEKDYLSNKFTENRFRSEWTRNYFYHAADVLKIPSIEQLSRGVSIETAIVVSSGPSLAKDIEWLKKLSPHVMILSAGSSIQALVKNGIKPHLSVIMDGHPVNEKIFSDPLTLDKPLLFTTSSYHAISDRKKDYKICSIMRNDAISRYLFDLFENECLIVPTQTVAGTAVQVAAALGAKRIIFAGQDLSFPEHKLYAEGVDHFSKEIVEQMANSALLKVLNVSGGYNNTDLSFSAMKQGLEDLIKAFSEIEFLNSSAYGAAIKGAPYSPIEEIYKLVLEEKVESNLLIDWIDANPWQRNPSLTSAVYVKLNNIHEGINALEMEIKILLRTIGKMQEFSRTKPVKSLKAFDEISMAWANIANLPWFAPVFETLIPLEIAAFDRKLPEIVNEQRLIEKSRLVQEHLGSFLNKISLQIPELKEMVLESLQRVELLGNSPSL